MSVAGLHRDRLCEQPRDTLHGRVVQAVTYMAQGKEVDGNPSLRYITLLRDGARAHSLPETHIWFLESVEHAQ